MSQSAQKTDVLREKALRAGDYTPDEAEAKLPKPKRLGAPAQAAGHGAAQTAGQTGRQAVPPHQTELPPVRLAHPHVCVEPDTLGGSPYVIGSKVPVRRLWAWHRGGASVETLLKRYPKLGPARILDALAFAYDNQQLIQSDIEREQALLHLTGERPVGMRPLAQMPLPFLD